MVTDLELAIWSSATPLQGTRFSAILRNARRSSPDTSMPHPTEQVMHWELSFDPAIQRAIAGGLADSMFQKVNVVDTDWITWNRAALRAISRVAAKCWSGVDPQIRMAFVDVDNCHPMWNMGVLVDLRSDSPGPWLKFEGLDGPDVRPYLAEIWTAARRTPTYDAAVDAARHLERDRSLMVGFAEQTQAGIEALNQALRTETIGEGARRGRQIVRDIYAGTAVEPIVDALRRHNHLVQEICAAIIGLAEELQPTTITTTIGAIRCTFEEDGGPCIRLTALDDFVAATRLTHPVLLDVGVPVDGLYTVLGYGLSFAQTRGFVDLSLVPLRWAEGRWPPNDADRDQAIATWSAGS